MNARMSSATTDRFAASSTSAAAQVNRSSSSSFIHDCNNFKYGRDIENGTRAEGSEASSSPFDMFRSMPISSRFSLQSFTNLIPSISWASSSSSSNSHIPPQPSKPPIHMYDGPNPLLSIIVDAQEKTKNKNELEGCVSKERQLARLEERILLERRKLNSTKMGGHVTSVVEFHYHDADDNYRERRGLKTAYGINITGRMDIGIEKCSRCSNDLISL